MPTYQLVWLPIGASDQSKVYGLRVILSERLSSASGTPYGLSTGELFTVAKARRIYSFLS